MEALLADLRDAQAKLRLRADRAPGVIGCADALARLEARMSGKPRVVVLGEGNAGKTSLVNLLLDQVLLPESVIANTCRPVVLRFAETVAVEGVTRTGRLDLTRHDTEPPDRSVLHRLEVAIPSPRLASFDLVDTPALSTPAELDPLGLGPADLLLWCTVAMQAWKESERRLWMAIPGRRRGRDILVATHQDGLRDDDDRRKVRARLAAETAGCFGAIAFACASGRREHSGAAELDALIAERLSVIAQRRYGAACRLANYIISKALDLLERGRRSPTPPVRRPIARSPISPWLAIDGQPRHA
jgi:hypothetical protein